MRKKAEPKFKITPTYNNENRLDRVVLPKSFDGILTIPEGVTYLGKFVCAEKLQIKEVFLPSSLHNLGIMSFQNCTNLARIHIPNGLQDLGDACFHGCSSLEEIHVPSSVTRLSAQSFYGFSRKTRVIIDEGNPDFHAGDQAIFSKDGKGFVCLLADVEQYAISDNIEAIWHRAFQCHPLARVAIPAGVKDIDEFAFHGCDNLECITIPDSVERFGDCFLGECPKLKWISISAHQHESVKQSLKGNGDDALLAKVVVRQ